jgi:tRNA dimethylallyltransferase
MADRALVITGPTASGKSAVAMAVAERLDGEIISMDSRQVYRGLDIGTAKPSADDQARVPHHGIDIIDPAGRYSAGQFARDARAWIRDIRSRGHTPVIAGGTLFFLRALQQPLFDEPPMDDTVRERLRAILAGWPPDLLKRWAAEVTLGELPVDPQRLARLIEVATLTGRPLSWWHAASPTSPGTDTTTFVMTLDRKALYRRIDARVNDMVARGLVDEVAGLVAQGYGREHPGMKTTGYLELIPHVQGELSVGDAVTAIQAATRQYARRQLTWLRTQLAGDVVELDASRPVDALADEVVMKWREGRA